jgi:hypothetical protein
MDALNLFEQDFVSFMSDWAADGDWKKRDRRKRARKPLNPYVFIVPPFVSDKEVPVVRVREKREYADP